MEDSAESWHGGQELAKSRMGSERPRAGRDNLDENLRQGEAEFVMLTVAGNLVACL